MFAAIKNSESTVKLLMNAKANATIHNYVRSFDHTLLFISIMQFRYILVLCLMWLLYDPQEGLTARQVARAKYHKSVENMLPKDPKAKGCVLSWDNITEVPFPSTMRCDMVFPCPKNRFWMRRNIKRKTCECVTVTARSVHWIARIEWTKTVAPGLIWMKLKTYT